MPLRTPLAWRNLTSSRRRLMIALLGVTFAVVLMFVELGFRNALLDSTVKLVEELNADIIIINRSQQTLVSQQKFHRARIVQASAIDGVKAAHPVYLESLRSILKASGNRGLPIRVIAYDLGEPVLDVPGPDRYRGQLLAPNTAIFDTKSKSSFAIAMPDGRLSDRRVELAGRELRIVGSFSFGTDFATDGNLIMSKENFSRYFPGRGLGSDPLSLVDIGLVQLENPSQARKMRRRIKDALPGDVAVYTKQDLIGTERDYWDRNTPVGVIFLIGTIMGFVVGMIICYQIIYGDIVDHMKEFATLKAMGYRSSFFIKVIIQQSVYLTVLGFIPGFVISLGIYYGLAYYTGLPLFLDVARSSLVLGLTLLMCILSGCLAIQKLLAADPAELF